MILVLPKAEMEPTRDLRSSSRRYVTSNHVGDKVMSKKTLYERLGGYDAISAVADDLLPRLQTDSQLARFWQHRGADGLKREKQLLVDFLCSSAGGPPLLHRTRHEGLP